MKRVIFLLSFCGLVCQQISGNPIQEDYEYHNPDDVRLITESHSAFAKDLYLLCANETEGNVILSPFSISAALGMLHLGSSGTTDAQIRSAMHLSQNKASIRRAFHDLISDFQIARPGFTLKTSNRVYVDDNFSILDEYNSTLTNDLHGSFHTVDFADSASASQLINSLVEQDTNSKIKDVVNEDAINSNTVMMLVNAVYFLGNWTNQFNRKDTSDRIFWTTPSTSVNVTTMYQTDFFHYAPLPELDAVLLGLDYKGNRISMNILLPNERDGIKDLEEKLSNVDLQSLNSQSGRKNIDLYLPKFKVETSLNLKTILTKMGVSDLFNREVADLSGIDGGRNLYASSAKHKAFIEVDETGTEAAAVTVFEISLISAISPSIRPIVVKVDHPFFFYIQDNRSKQILFTGRINNPT